MWLVKDKSNKGGYVITLFIGNKGYSSWWSSPPENIDNVGLEYLKDRYSIITTKKRLEDFKLLYKNLWIEIPEEMKDEMSHCLGLDYKKKPYRNRFCADKNDEIWTALVEKGLAEKSSRVNSYGTIMYWLSKQGLCYILNKSVSDNYYNSL